MRFEGAPKPLPQELDNGGAKIGLAPGKGATIQFCDHHRLISLAKAASPV